MARPKEGYKLKNGDKVDGITTITSRFKESGGLMYWACKMGQKYHDLPTHKALYGERDEAADIGTLAHELFQLYLRGKKGTYLPVGIPDDVIKKAGLAFQNACNWWKQQNAKILEMETSLVSEEHKYGGTFDILASINKQPELYEIKTGGVYVDSIMQVAAQSQLLKEAKRIKVKGYNLLRFSKEEADFSHRHFDNLDDALEMFLLLRQAYDLDKKLRKRL